MRAAALVIFIGSALTLLGWVGLCVMFIATAPPDDRAYMVGPNLGLLTIVIMILAPAVILGIPAWFGVRGVRWPLSIVGALYLIVSVMTLIGGEPLAIPFIVYSLLWMILLWVGPQPPRKETASSS